MSRSRSISKKKMKKFKTRSKSKSSSRFRSRSRSAGNSGIEIIRPRSTSLLLNVNLSPYHDNKVMKETGDKFLSSKKSNQNTEESVGVIIAPVVNSNTNRFLSILITFFTRKKFITCFFHNFVVMIRA
jgi:hypothetical protein